MKIHDQSIPTIYEALLEMFRHCFLTTMFLNMIGIRSHAQLFLVDSAVIEYKFHSLGYDVVVVERAQNPMMQKKRPPVCRSPGRVRNPPRRSEKRGDSNQINVEGFYIPTGASLGCEATPIKLICRVLPFELPTGVSLGCLAMPVAGTRWVKMPRPTGALRVSSVVVIHIVVRC